MTCSIVLFCFALFCFVLLCFVLFCFAVFVLFAFDATNPPFSQRDILRWVKEEKFKYFDEDKDRQTLLATWPVLRNTHPPQSSESNNNDDGDDGEQTKGEEKRV